MKFPKVLIISGIKWKIIFDRKTNGGEFYWATHTIKIDKKYSDERKFSVLVHEISEAILVNNMMRYQKTLAEVHNGDYLFVFDHDKFEIFTDELAGVIKQLTLTKG
jgi:hypothetical protein